MKELLTYKKTAFAVLTAVKKPAVAVPAVGLVTFSSYQLGIFLLLFFMTLDFITGVLASWILWKDSKAQSNFWKYGFSSRRLRLSVVKSVTYFFFILSAYGLEWTFKLKPIGSSYSDHKVTITLITIAISCSIELYSIFFENLPKAGFDIEQKVRAIFIKVKNAVKSVRELRDGDNNSTT